MDSSNAAPSPSVSNELENEGDPETGDAEGVDAEGAEGTSTTEFKKMVRAKLKTGEYIAEGKPNGNVRQSKTDFWECFLQVKVAATKLRVDVIVCTGCRELFIYRGHSIGSSAISRHVKRCAELRQAQPGSAAGTIPSDLVVDPSPLAKYEFSKVSAHFCAEDLRPPNAMAGEGLISLVQKAIDLAVQHGARLDAKKLVPHPKTVSAYIASEAAEARKKLVDEVLPALRENRCAATTDGWTEAYRSGHFSNIVLHYIEDWEMVTRLAFSLSVEGATSSDQLKGFLIDKLVEIGIPYDFIENIIFVTDGGADIVKALEEYRRLYCMCHAINIVVRTAFTVKYAALIERVIKSSPLATSVVKEANEWVKYVRNRLPKKHELLKELKVTVPASQSHTPMLKAVRDLRDQVSSLSH